MILKVTLLLLGLACCVISVYDANTLKKVLVITRHGDRVPLEAIPNVAPVSWFCEEASLIQVDENYHSGDENHSLYRMSYIVDSGKLPGNCSLGQLTSVGFQQHLELGAKLRRRYPDSLIPESFSSEFAFLRSSESLRCRQSAVGFTESFFPSPSKEIPIPLHTIDGNLDAMQVNVELCPKLGEILAEDVWSNISLQATVADALGPILPELTAALNSSNPFAGLLYFDTLNCMVDHNKPLPGNLSMHAFAILAGAMNQVGLNLFQSTAFGLCPFWNDLAKDLGSISSRTFSLYSGHDTTVGPLLSQLGVTPSPWPPYASYVAIELHASSSSSSSSSSSIA